MIRQFCALGLALVLALAVSPASALNAALPKPSGRVLLTVTGAIEHTNAEGRAELDRETLESIGMVELETRTPFTKGTSVFRGVLVRDLLRYLGASGLQIEAGALDLYKVTIPIEDFERFDVLIALEANGKKLRVRDHGPAWIIYPWSQHEELDRELYQGRSIWQMISIDVQ